MSTLKALVVKATVVTACLACSAVAHSNLIYNGGFEYPNINSGWTQVQDSADGWQGDRIEVWVDGFLGVESPEGRQHGELNSHGARHGDAWSIFQTFDTTQGSLYDFGFSYRARKNDSEAFRFQIYDSFNTSLIDLDVNDHVVGEWEHYSGSFWGTGNSTTLRLTAVQPTQWTVGNLVDDVYVNAVPAPPAALLMLSGLVGFGFVRRLRG